ncbi:hypothetical protein Tco_0287274 [Tanacetum coccineum]
MSDSEDSTVTYTAVSSPFEDGSDIGSPGVDGPPIMPEDPYAYIMAAYQVPPSPDYIPGPEEDEILLDEEQPLPAAASPTADSPGYVPESDPEEEPEEDDEDPEEDPADYPADRDDDDDDDEDEDEDEEEEEEHPASADSIPPVHHMTARISIRDEPSISLPPREEVERLLALTTPPPSPLTHFNLLVQRHKARGLFYQLERGWVLTLIRQRRAKEVCYGIRDVWVDPREAVKEVAPITLGGVNTRVTELTVVQEQDTQDIYAVIEDTQDRQTQIYQSVETLVDD